MGRVKTTQTLGEAWAALQTALREDDPDCRDDARFTQDDADPGPLRIICSGCPIFDPCRTLAQMNPQGKVYGILGGLVRRAEPKARQSALIR